MNLKWNMTSVKKSLCFKSLEKWDYLKHYSTTATDAHHVFLQQLVMMLQELLNIICAFMCVCTHCLW